MQLSKPKATSVSVELICIVEMGLEKLCAGNAVCWWYDTAGRHRSTVAEAVNHAVASARRGRSVFFACEKPQRWVASSASGTVTNAQQQHLARIKTIRPGFTQCNRWRYYNGGGDHTSVNAILPNNTKHCQRWPLKGCKAGWIVENAEGMMVHRGEIPEPVMLVTGAMELPEL